MKQIEKDDIMCIALCHLYFSFRRFLLIFARFIERARRGGVGGWGAFGFFTYCRNCR